MNTHRVKQVCRVLSRYRELATVLVAAVIGLSFRAPFTWLASHQGINILLAVLVFATAVTIEPAALRRLTKTWRVLLASLAAGVTILPALSWAVSRIVEAGSLRNGVMTVGLAPCEIASIATTSMAGGEQALSAGVLIGSTVAAVAVAGPILSLESGHVSVHPAHIIANLALVVVLPLVVGVGLRAAKAAGIRVERVAGATVIVTVAGLVALIAAEIHFSLSYLAVAGALALFVAGSAALGRLVGIRSPRPIASSVLLTMSMRDFAIAAGIATAGFGAESAAPLGLYGVMVLVWGTGIAGRLRERRGAVATEETLD